MAQLPGVGVPIKEAMWKNSKVKLCAKFGSAPSEKFAIYFANYVSTLRSENLKIALCHLLIIGGGAGPFM